MAATTTGTLISSSLVAYPLARMEFTGKNIVFSLIIATMMIPNIALIIPQYIMFGKLQIENVISQTLDTETLCNIVTVKPSEKFPGQRIYFDLSLFLQQATRE
jgi:ABC-type glycerol-3-phosphate transport system permease component